MSTGDPPSAGGVSGGSSLPLAIAASTYAALVVGGSGLLRDGDVYLHVAIGRWMLQHGEVPARDTFSHSMAGAPCTSHEWLAEIAFALAHQLGGWTLVVALTAVAVSLALHALARHLGRHLPARYVLLFVALGAMLVASHLHARPHALALPCLVILLVELAAAREDDRSPRLGFLGLVVLWANLHGSFPVAAILVAAFGLEAVLAAGTAARLATARSWGTFLALSLVAMSITPLGPGGFAFAAHLEGDAGVLATIDEWRPPDFSKFHPLQLWLGALIAGGLALRVRVPWMRLVLLTGLVYFSLRRARHAELLGMIAPVLLAPAFGAALARRAARLPGVAAISSALGTPGMRPRPTLLVAVIASGVVIASLVRHVGSVRPAARITPEHALAAAARAGANGPVLNAYDFGGYLVLRRVPTFVDGRADLYGGKFLHEYASAVTGAQRPTLERLLAHHGITWTLLPPHAGAIELLDRMPDWKRSYTDDVAVVHLRASTATYP